MSLMTDLGAWIGTKIKSLTDNLSVEIEDRKTSVSNETTRAKDAEKILTDNLTAEISNRESGDTTLQTNIDNEVTRAKDAEKILTDNLNTETARAKDVEKILTDNLSIEKGRIDSILDSSEADKDSFKEIVDLINSVDTENDDTFAGYVSSNNERSTTIETNIDNEVTRAKDAEKVLTDNLTAEISNRESGDTTLQTNIDNEVTRAKDAENIRYTKDESDNRFVHVSGDIIDGDLQIGKTTKESNNILKMQVASGYKNLIELTSEGQGSADIYLGQTTDQGFGFLYNADDTPDELESDDYAVFYRVSGGTHSTMFKWKHDQNFVTFANTPKVGNVPVSLTTHSHNYLSRNGGTMDGDITLNTKNDDGTNSNSYSILFNGSNDEGTDFAIRSKGEHLEFYEGSEDNGKIHMTIKDDAGVDALYGFLENGVKLSDKYLGKTSKATDSDKLDGKDSSEFATSSHNHDDRYYTESESDSRYVNVSGDTMSANLNFNNTNTGINWSMNTDGASIKFYNTGDSDSNSRLEFEVRDNGNEYFRWVNDGEEKMTLKGGDLTVTGDMTANSDKSLKENIEVIPNAIEKIKQINGVTFTRNDLDDTTKRYTGVIAQDVEKVLPEAVKIDNKGIKSVAYGNTVGLLIEAIKSQQLIIETLTERVEKLEGK